MPDTFHSLNYHDDRLLNQMRESFLAGGGGISPAVQVALDSLQAQISSIPVMHQKSIILNNSQIIDLKNTPVEIVAPTEILNYSGSPTTLPVIQIGSFRWKTFSGGYGDIDAGSKLKIVWGSDASADIASTVDFQAFNSSGAFLPIAQFGFPFVGPQSSLKDNIQDNGIFVYLSNSVILSAGHPDNELEVIIGYRIYNFATGQYE